MRPQDKCSLEGKRVVPCDKRLNIGPSEYAYGKAVHCAYCDAFLRLVEPVKKGK